MKNLNFPIQNSLSSEKFPNSPDFSRHIYSKYSYSKLSTYKCTPALCSGSVLCSTVLYCALCSVRCAIIQYPGTVVLPGTYCMCSGALCSGDRHNSSSAWSASNNLRHRRGCRTSESKHTAQKSTATSVGRGRFGLLLNMQRRARRPAAVAAFSQTPQKNKMAAQRLPSKSSLSNAAAAATSASAIAFSRSTRISSSTMRQYLFVLAW